jgi:hypothetical protein
VLRPLEYRLMRYAPTKLSSALPVAIAREVLIDPAVVRLAMKAPRKMAGETRYPSSNTVPRAYPVGGQTGGLSRPLLN